MTMRMVVGLVLTGPAPVRRLAAVSSGVLSRVAHQPWKRFAYVAGAEEAGGTGNVCDFRRALLLHSSCTATLQLQMNRTCFMKARILSRTHG